MIYEEWGQLSIISPLRLGYVFVNLDMKVYTVHYGEGLIVRLDLRILPGI